MKKTLLSIFLISLHAYSQDFFILKTDGSKVFFQNNSLLIDASNREVFYKPIDKNIEKSISYKELDCVEYNSYKFKAFKLNNSSKVDGFFVLCESADKTLVCIGIPDDDTDSSNPKISYVFHVLDKQNNVLESHNFNNSKDIKNWILRSEIYVRIRNYFPKCDELIKRLADYDKNSYDQNDISILGFFKYPVYFTCN